MIYSEQKDATKTVNNIENLLFRMEEESGDPESPESCYVKSTSATTIDEEDLLRYSRSQTPTAESDKIENEDESCARSLRFFENPFEYPENESERKKLISVALQQEDEFLEYLMSLPAVTKEKQADQTAEAHHPEPPGFMRSTSTYSSSSGGPKVGLDHLDNLCKLMEQLGDLRDQNSKLQRKVQYLEDIKNLQEMHKQLHQDTKQRRLQDEELLKILLHSHRNRGPGSTHIKRHVRREEYEGNLTDSCLLDHGGSEESLSNIKTEPTMNTRSTKCKSISHSKMRQYLMHSHQRGRSRSVGIEELKAKDDDDYDERRRSKRHEKSRQRRSIAAVTGGSCKSKVSKWTKVKEAFRWEKASATMLPDSKSTDSGIGVVSSISCDDSKHLKVPPPESLKGDHSPNLLSVSPVDSVLSGLSSSVCSSGGQSPGSLMCHPLRDFGVTVPGNLSSSSSSDDLEIDLNFNDMFAELECYLLSGRMIQDVSLARVD
uniref:Uncharacterized protein n=1 Tax=Timema monikensis TaxID=170555 RepID=A0A7R9HUS4_9NEOP|nr:unnamed protein product [Timema monikensis]